jgi:hypothetical protein
MICKSTPYMLRALQLFGLALTIFAIYACFYGVPGAEFLSMAGGLTILPAAMSNARQRALLTMQPTVFPSTTSRPIPRDFVYDAFKLSLAVQVDVAAGGGADGALTAEQPMNIIREIRILGSSSSRASVAEIRKIDLAALRVLTGLLQHSLPIPAALAIPGIQAASQVGLAVEIPFYLPRCERPGVAALNSHELQSLDLEVDWGADTDIITGGTRTTVFSNAILQLHGIERLEDLSNQTRFAVNMTRYQEITGVTANGRFPIEIKGTRILRGILIKQFTRAAGITFHTPVNTLINALTLEVNGTAKIEYRTNGRANSGWLLLQRDNDELYQVVTPVGYGFIDLMRDGALSKLLRESDYTNLNLILDTNTVANGVIRAYLVEILDLSQ